MRLFQRNQILTIPNLLSLLRLLMIPLIPWLYIGRQAYGLTVLVVLLSGLTDIADGYIARTFHMVSDLGKILDPVADKLTQAALILCLIARYPGMLLVFILFAAKDILLLVMGAVALKRYDAVNSARWFGKLSTVTLYLSAVLLILLPSPPVWFARLLMGLCAGVILLSCLLYVRFYLGFFRDRRAS